MIRSALDKIVEGNCYYDRILFNTAFLGIDWIHEKKTGVKNGLDFLKINVNKSTYVLYETQKFYFYLILLYFFADPLK